VIATSDGSRKRFGWRFSALSFVTGAIASGLAVGLSLGELGSRFGAATRVPLAGWLAVAALVVGLLEARGSIGQPIQLSVESPRRWSSFGPILWPLANGAILGIGFATRIGFWLWWIVPFSALLSGSPQHGALVYGCYALARSASAGVVMMLPRLSPRPDWGKELIAWRRPATRVSGVTLATVAVVTMASLWR
jgi:hypothetical protein